MRAGNPALAFLLLLAASPLAHAWGLPVTDSCAGKPRPAFEESGADERPVAPLSCPKAPYAFLGHPDSDLRAACAADVQNCACALIGTANCADTVKNGAAAATHVRIDPKGERSIILDDKDGELMEGITRLARRKGGREEEFYIPYSKRLTQLSTAAALLAVLNETQNGRDSGSQADAVAATREYLMLSDSLEACHDIEARLRDAARPASSSTIGRMKALGRKEADLVDDAAAEGASTTLMCLFRNLGDLPKHRVLPHWPGKRCLGGPEGKQDYEHGVMIGGACVTSKYTGSFTSSPIDERMPAVLERFVKTLASRVAGYGLEVIQVHIMGCGEERLDTGDDMAHFRAKMKDHVFGMSLVGDHAQGTACDISGVTFWDAKKCQKVEFTFKDFRDDLLEKEGKGRTWRDIYNKRYFARTCTVGKTYRDIEEKQRLAREKNPDAPVSPAALGAASRNALADAGLFILDPLVNTVHVDHFHVEIPPGDGDFAALQGGTPAGRDAGEEFSRRFAGVSGPCEAPK